jgi:hypothetical protein
MAGAECCRVCGAVRDNGQASALSWVCERRPEGRPVWLCERCARAHLRDIESKLPDEWW